MLVDALQELAQAGFPIRTYTYIGMGSIYFVDFILLHKFLGIDKLITVEQDNSLAARVKFNKPFARVKIVMDRIGNVLSTLDRDTRYLLWLDYDQPLTADIAEDIRLSVNLLRSGSILLVTLPIFLRNSREKEQTFAYYQEQAEDYFGVGWDHDKFSPSRIEQTITEILWNIVSAGMQARVNVWFQPLFYFRYADGREMLTIGGMVCDEHDRRTVRGCSLAGKEYVRKSFKQKPFRIEVPALTRK